MDCRDCKHHYQDALTICPHCDRPRAHFPNVTTAARANEVAAVQARYDDAVQHAQARGCGIVATQFEAAVVQGQAVIGRTLDEAMRLASSDKQAYATYYNLLHAGVRLPDENKWDRLRGLADFELFGLVRDEVRFAVLSLDGTSLPNYGAVSLELAEPMIAHRATLLDENSAVFFERERANGHEPPHIVGHRARWEDRGKLALAKHGGELDPATSPGAFAAMVLRAGDTPAEDVFLEVHVYGSLTRRSLSKVVLLKSEVPSAVELQLRDLLKDVDVVVEIR